MRPYFELIQEYFPDLSKKQLDVYELLWDIYHEWNTKINVISRKDIDDFYLKHVLHSLSIAKIFKFSEGTKILDVGTGGGFPGIPLAIYYPECEFTLIDSIGKKIGKGLAAIPEKSAARKMMQTVVLQPCPADRIERERLIFRTYNCEYVNVARNLP